MTIPKFIFQMSRIKPTYYQIDSIKEILPDWEYKHFSDEDMIKFIEEHPVEKLAESVSFMKKHKSHGIKYNFFRYYLLYVNGGVYMNNCSTLVNNLDEYVNSDISLFSVKSGLNNNTMFEGFMGAEKNNSILFNEMIRLLEADEKTVTEDSTFNSKNLYNILITNKNIL